MTSPSTTATLDSSPAVDELVRAVLRGARAMAVALEDLDEAPDSAHAAEAADRLDLTVRLTAEMARLYETELAFG